MPRVSNRPDPEERPSSFVSLLSGWVQQGIESFFATQRILVDLAMRQNTSAMNTIRQEISRAEANSGGPDCPRNLLLEMAVEGTSNYIEAQRILLDLAQQENEIVLNGVGERVGDYRPVAITTNILRRSINTFLEMQQNFLTLASRGTQSWLESEDSAEKSERVNLASEAMKEFVATQKKFLAVISEESEGSTYVKKADRTELVELGRAATDSFIKAQKRLLDLAGQQANASMTSMNRAVDIKMPIRLTPIMDVAGDGVKGFVDAEKALVDSMMKTRSRVKTSAEHTPPKPRATKKRRSRAATAAS